MKQIFCAFLFTVVVFAYGAEDCGRQLDFKDLKEREIGASMLPLYDSEIVTWSEGFPPDLNLEQTSKLKPEADSFVWARVDLDSKLGPEVLLASYKLQGSGGRYWNYVNLRIYCQENSLLQECSQFHLLSPPHFRNSRLQKSSPVKDYGYDYLTPSFRIGIFKHKDKTLIGVFEDRKSMAPAMLSADFYHWSALLTEISPFCQQRKKLKSK